jgi:hypothetical protein
MKLVQWKRSAELLLTMQSFKNIVLVSVWIFVFYQGLESIVFQWHFRHPSIRLGEVVKYNDRTKVEFRSWTEDPIAWSWSLGSNASVLFRIADQPDPGKTCQVTMELGPGGASQPVRASIDGWPLSPLVIEKRGQYTRSFPCERLRKDLNELKFEFSSVSSPKRLNSSPDDDRPLGIGLVSFVIAQPSAPRR